MDYSPPGSSVHRIPQARRLEWMPCSPSGDRPDPGIKLNLLCLLHGQASLYHWQAPVVDFPVFTWKALSTALDQCILNCNVWADILGVMLKCRFSFRRSGRRPSIGASNKLPGDVLPRLEAATPGVAVRLLQPQGLLWTTQHRTQTVERHCFLVTPTGSRG